MTREEAIRERTTRINQALALKKSLEFLGLGGRVPPEDSMLAGAARGSIVRSTSEHTADAFRKDKVMPDGFTLTVCYGESSLLPRVPGWAAQIQPNATYVFGFDSVAGAIEHSRRCDAAMMRVEGSTLKAIVSRILEEARQEPSRWPVQLMWVEQDCSSGVVFSEYAGTPDVPKGDDKRIFEVSCW